MVDSAKQGQAVSTTKFGPSATSHPNIIWKSDPTLHEASWNNVIVFFFNDRTHELSSLLNTKNLISNFFILLPAQDSISAWRFIPSPLALPPLRSTPTPCADWRAAAQGSVPAGRAPKAPRRRQSQRWVSVAAGHQKKWRPEKLGSSSCFGTRDLGSLGHCIFLRFARNIDWVVVSFGDSFGGAF